MPLSPGTRLGAYEIVSPLGAGGMGEVYRARDSKLNRDVAIKVLPELFAGDPERLARFTREAQTLAALNHPNIAHIHGLEESDSVRALVMELVEGEDLSTHIARGPMPLAEALAIARQIADALEAAHEQGIVHRDLKPANVKIRADGTVKVLDFGLAKAMEPAGMKVASGATMTSPAMTMRGMILGTAAYMSPEQARGKPVDRRTDIWAFGCVLFEMLSGKETFDTGDTVSDAIASVLGTEPDWNKLPADLPANLQSVLRRCLQKDVRKRFRDIGDVRFEIDEGSAVGPPVAALHAPKPAGWRLAASAVAIALVAAAGGGVAVWRFAPPAPKLAITRLSFPLPEGQQFSRVGHQSVAISPDGSQVVYVANGRLYTRALSELTAKEIPGTNLGAEHPAFSPDGQSIVFGARNDSSLKRIAVTGGAPVAICPAGAVFGLSWAGDG